RIPFNGGEGGPAERIIGASENGMSNNFPKVSPDGKWIVFVQCKNGLLMRPDSKLYIVPFEGGEARPLQSNLPVMNSWHTFSPNGHWLAFSSKSPSLYTHLYLTHIDDQGNASAPVVVENATASNRAVNIPEFVNLGPEGLDHIDTPAIDFYREFDAAQQLQDTQKYAEAVPAWKVAAAKDPTDSRPYNNMGVALAATGKTAEAIEEYQKALSMNNDSSQGGHRQDAIDELTKGIELAPKSSDGHNIFGVVLARMGKLDDAIAEMQKAVDLAPGCVECRFNLGRALAASNRFADALPQFEEAVRLSNGEEPAILQMLASVYSETGQYSKAVSTAQHALELAVRQQNDELATALRANLARYQHQAQQVSGPGGNP
ncbi:MAG: tetratricopeptide repeat protein, partial [Terracidiphilus sp.]